METIRILFASDFHGSDKVYRKFLNAGKIHNANYLIAGGDLTGKAIVPIVKQSANRHTLTYKGQELEIHSQEELSKIIVDIRNSGYYPYETTPEKLEKIDSEMVRELFLSLMKEGIENWVRLAEERVRGVAEVYLLPGNDDTFEIDSVISNSTFVKNPEGQVTMVGAYPMVATGFSNMTPWKAPRDIPEDRLFEKLDEMFRKVSDAKNCILVSHVPPFASGLDFAPKLTSGLKPEMSGGGPVNVPVGSESVRKAIETYQPLLALHGHIHESPGVATVGRTICINPGSAYENGILKAAVLTLHREDSTAELDKPVFITG
jgi:Icc-related predicted phosphoesterase